MTHPSTNIPWPGDGLPTQRIQSLEPGENYAGPGLLQAASDLEAVQVFLWLKRSSPKTLEGYRRECQRFLLWATAVAHRRLGDLRPQDLEAYVRFAAQPPASWCGNARGKTLARDPGLWRPFTVRTGPLSANSLKTQLATLGSLFGFLQDGGYLKHNPMALVPKSALVRELTGERGQATVGFKKTWTAEQWAIIKESLAGLPECTRFQQAAKRRLTLWLVWLYEGGLRISDLVGARHGDAVYSETTRQWVIRVEGKGGKTDALPVTDRALQELTRYRRFHGLSEHPVPNEALPFLASVWPFDEQGEPKSAVGASEARRALKRLLKTAEALATEQGLANPEHIAHGSLHSIRHRRAQNLLAAGEHLRTVQSILRHRRIETTAIYTEPEDEQRRRALENEQARF